MARKKSTDINLTLPALALSALVFLLVIFVINIPNQTPDQTADAARRNYLSRSDDIESLENDLVLLEVDETQQEITILENLE